AGGRFRFDNVSAGRHALRTVWIGYQPDERTADVPASGLELTIVLTPVAFQLDTLQVVARVRGIRGAVVAHADLRSLGGADVQVLGTSLRRRRGSDGRFEFPDLRPGAYMIRAE